MSEIDDLIAVLGAADLAVSSEQDETRSRELAETVVDLVPAYRGTTKFGWYRDYLESVGAERQLPDIDEAIRNLAEPTRFVSMLPRRVMAVALAARVFPDRFGPDGNERGRADAVTALAIPGIVRSLPPVPTPPNEEPPPRPSVDDQAPRDEGQQLLAALAAPATPLSGSDDWQTFISINALLLSDQFRSLPAPCKATLVELSGADPIGLLQTTHCVEGVDLATLAAGFLNPVRWPLCCAWWCAMLPAPSIAPGVGRYLEVVAADCPEHPLKVAVFLDFARPVDTPTAKVVTYNLSQDQSGMFGGHAANGAVTVDQGAIELRTEGNHLHVATAKRIRFAAFDTSVLSAIACWVGYGDTATELILNCADGQAHAFDCAQGGDLAALAAPPVETPLADAVRHVAGVARARTAEAAEQARAVAEHLDLGDYTPDAVAEDAARVAALLGRGWATVVKAVVDALRRVARPPHSSGVPESPAFHVNQIVPEKCELRLAGPLTSPYGGLIDESRIELRPRSLDTAPGDFRLAVLDASGLEGSAYTGHVLVQNAATTVPVGRVDVYVIVP